MSPRAHRLDVPVVAAADSALDELLAEAPPLSASSLKSKILKPKFETTGKLQENTSRGASKQRCFSLGPQAFAMRGCQKARDRVPAECPLLLS